MHNYFLAEEHGVKLVAFKPESFYREISLHAGVLVVANAAQHANAGVGSCPTFCGLDAVCCKQGDIGECTDIGKYKGVTAFISGFDYTPNAAATCLQSLRV